MSASTRDLSHSGMACAAGLRLAPGTELLGEYQSSAFEKAQFLVRRGDGQVIQTSRLLYLVASSLNGCRDHTEVAYWVSERFGRPVSPDNIDYLVTHKLRPLGLIQAEG